MIDIYLILAGFGIGLTLAAPGGPVNILCVQRTLTHGFQAGLAVGLGAVIGDGLLAFVAASGLSVVAALLQKFAAEIQIFGGAILIFFGLAVTRSHMDARAGQSALTDIRGGTEQHPERLRDHLHTIPKTFLLTVTNPGAMLGAFVLFGGLASVFGAFPTTADIVVVVLAVVAGNLSWWFGLSYTVARLRHRVCTQRLRTVNRFAGFALITFGALLLVRGGVTLDVARLTSLALTTATSGAT